MGVFTDHPHTAITERVNSIVRDEELTPEIEIPELLGLIKLQYYGPTEAARAIRKKLKYGNKAERPRALEVLHLIVVNGGSPLAELYNDRKLLEYLRILANDQTADMDLRKRVIGYAILWNEEFQGQKDYTGIASLKKQLPKVKRVKRRNDYFMNDEALSDDDESSEAGSSSIATSHSSSRPSRQSTINPNDKYRIPKINLQKEGPKIKALIAEASKSSIDLINALRTINRSRGDKSTDDPRCTQLFEKSRIVRRRILRYLQLVESEEYLGSLIHANEELVDALQLYTEYASSPGSDSDSDSYSSVDSDSDDESDTVSVSESLASRMIEQHERSKITSNNDPFSDFNRVDESADWK